MKSSSPSGFEVHEPAYLSVTEQLRSEITDHRIGQSNLEPAAVKPRALGEIVESSHSGLGNGSVATVVIPNSSSGTFVFSLSDDLNRVILAVPDISWYIGSVSVATQWPNVSFGMGNMRSTVWNDWGSSDNVGVVTKLIVRNDTGAEQTVIAICRWRIIKSATAQFEQGQITAS